MSLSVYRKLFCGFTLVCMVLRGAMVVWNTEHFTGFYKNGLVGILYLVLLAAGCAFFVFMGNRLTPPSEPLPSGKWETPLLLLCAVGTAVSVIPAAQKALAGLGGTAYVMENGAITAVSTQKTALLQLGGFVLLPLTAVVLFLLLSRKNPPKIALVFLLCTLLWQTVFLLTQFIDFTAARHVASQTLSLVSAGTGLLFLLAMGRVKLGYDPNHGLQQLRQYGACFALLGLVTAVGSLTELLLQYNQRGFDLLTLCFYLPLALYDAYLLCTTDTAVEMPPEE